MFGSNQNTGSAFGSSTASGGGLFGSSAPKPSGGGLFGSASAGSSPFGASNNNAASSAFGSNNAASNTNTSAIGANNNPGSSGMFGSTPNNTNAFGSSAPATGGLFGAKQPAAPATNTAGGGLFGSNTGAAAGGGLFGSANNNAAAPALASGGLFGSSNNTNNATGGLFEAKSAAPANVGGGLFGSSNNTATSGTAGGLFGSSGAGSAAPATGGLFGSKPAATTGGGLFGSNTSAESGGLFGAKPAATGGLFGGNSSSTGGGLFGGNNANTASANGGLFGSGAVGGAANGMAAPQGGIQLTAMTRVGDLPPQFKKELEDFDRYINTQHAIATTLEEDMNKHNNLIRSIPSDTRYLKAKISSTKQALHQDSSHLANLKEINNELLEDLNKIMNLIVQLSTPGTRLSSSMQLNEFFIKKIHKYHDLILNYEAIAAEAEQTVISLERLCVDGFGGLFNIIEVIKSQYSLFMELCDIMGVIHSKVERLNK